VTVVLLRDFMRFIQMVVPQENHARIKFRLFASSFDPENCVASILSSSAIDLRPGGFPVQRRQLAGIHQLVKIGFHSYAISRVIATPSRIDFRAAASVALPVDAQNRLGSGSPQHQPRAILRDKFHAVVRFYLRQR